MKNLFLSIFIIFLTACGSDNNNTNDQKTTEIDLTNALLSSRSANCTDYINSYASSVKDIGKNRAFNGHLTVTQNAEYCSFSGNAIPNHDFNDGGNFATEVSEQNQLFSITQNPQIASTITAISLIYDNAVFINGVKLDLLAAGCYGVGNGKIGCNDTNQPFRYDPMSSLTNFGTDKNNAHTQPDGTYHYHGNPMALFQYDSTPTEASPVIGFAADGFPIFGSYIEKEGIIRKAKSSYKLKSGNRIALTYKGKNYNPSGQYDGTFVDDWQYQENYGDLDECNGMTNVDGNYGYYITDNYPWVLTCFKGTPDPSFQKN